MTRKQKQAKLRINTLIDIEETMIRLKLKQDPDYALQMLSSFRPGASLRQINNSIPRANHANN